MEKLLALFYKDLLHIRKTVDWYVTEFVVLVLNQSSAHQLLSVLLPSLSCLSPPFPLLANILLPYLSIVGIHQPLP